MKKVFTVKELISPEEYLNKMLACIDENGELTIARECDEVCFCTAHAQEDASHIEKVQLNKSAAKYDSLFRFYEQVRQGIEDGTLPEDFLANTSNKYATRLRTVTKRIAKLISMDAPTIIIENEKTLLMDCVVLYKTDAVGDLYAVEKDR